MVLKQERKKERKECVGNMRTLYGFTRWFFFLFVLLLFGLFQTMKAGMVVVCDGM